jgi:GH15 family glucan-1,4-alpha-glucosidase
MVLALAPIFLDERFTAERSKAAFGLIERLARKAVSVAGLPDAGIWEYRTEWKPQTFSNLMCWAAADRMARVASLHAPMLELDFRSTAEKIREEIVSKSWCSQINGFAATYGGHDLDASPLQMAYLRFLPFEDTRLIGTMEAIRGGLSNDGWLFRYRLDDGFGSPKVAFIICTFWLVQALGGLASAEAT